MMLLDLVVEDGQAVDHELRKTRRSQLRHTRDPSNAARSRDGQAEDDGKHLTSTRDEVSYEATASNYGLVTWGAVGFTGKGIGIESNARACLKTSAIAMLFSLAIRHLCVAAELCAQSLEVWKLPSSSTPVINLRRHETIAEEVYHTLKGKRCSGDDTCACSVQQPTNGGDAVRNARGRI